MIRDHVVGWQALTVSACVALLVGLACSSDLPIADRCTALIATLQPPSPTLHVGDTLTMHAAFTGSPDCFPTDTTAAGLRWDGYDAAVSVDTTSGHLQALAAGEALIGVRAVGSQANLGLTTVVVVAP